MASKGRGEDDSTCTTPSTMDAPLWSLAGQPPALGCHSVACARPAAGPCCSGEEKVVWALAWRWLRFKGRGRSASFVQRWARTVSAPGRAGLLLKLLSSSFNSLYAYRP